MTTQQDVRDIAKKVRESANDLRYLEICGAFMNSKDIAGSVAGEGDTGAARYQEWSPESTAGAAIKAAQAGRSAPLGTEFDWLTDYYEYYARVSDEPYVAMFDTLGGVCKSLAPNTMTYSEKIEGRFHLGDWRGEFADNLYDNVIAPLEDVAINQTQIIAELQAAVLAHREIVLAARQSIVYIGSETKATLDAIIGKTKSEPNVEAGLSVLGVVLAIAGIATALPTGGASLSAVGLALAILGAAKSVADTAISLDKMRIEAAKKVPVVITGSTSSDIIASMLSEIGKLDQQIMDEEQTLADKLETSIKEVEAWRANTSGAEPKAWLLQSFRSELADDNSPDRDEFDHVDQ